MVEQYAMVPFVAQAKRTRSKKDGEPGERSHRYAMHLLRLLDPLVRVLDATVDKRPLRSLVQTVEAIVAFRNRHQG
jgi:CRISPR/Cas system CSM-associated protein Csm2 small subunit